jgi:hypothetical protein
MIARGTKAEDVQKAAERVNKHAKDSADFLEGMQVVSTIRMSVQLLRSIEAAADDKMVTLTAMLNATPAAVLSLPFLTDEEGPAPEETPANPRLRK